MDDAAYAALKSDDKTAFDKEIVKLARGEYFACLFVKQTDAARYGELKKQSSMTISAAALTAQRPSRQPSPFSRTTSPRQRKGSPRSRRRMRQARASRSHLCSRTSASILEHATRAENPGISLKIARKRRARTRLPFFAEATQHGEQEGQTRRRRRKHRRRQQRARQQQQRTRTPGSLISKPAAATMNRRCHDRLTNNLQGTKHSLR